MTNVNWSDSMDAAITVCDGDGVIIYMNEASQKGFEKDGGKDLIGKSIFPCHTPESEQKILQLMAEGKTNIYTIQKKGRRKLIYQAPIYENGNPAGMVEISFVIPEEMPHHNRDA